MRSRGARAATRVATWVIAFAVGAVYATAGTVAQAYAPLGIPVGLVLSLIGFAALLVAVRMLVGSRWTTLATGLGAVAATLLFSGTGPGGSVLMPRDLLAISWTIAVPVVVALAVAWPDVRTTATAAAAAAAATSGPEVTEEDRPAL